MNSTVPYVAPFLRPLLTAPSRVELVREYLPELECDMSMRLLTHRGIFEEPVTCALYEALYRYRRAGFVKRLVDELWSIIRRLPDRAVVVEAGCGPGHVLCGLAKQAGKDRQDLTFVGFDPSVEMIYLARRYALRLEIPNITFLYGDSSNAEVAEWIRAASLVLARNVLSWMENPQAELSHWRNLLPRGAILWSREVRRDIRDDHLYRRMIESCQFEDSEGHIFYYPPRAYLVSILRAFTAQEHEQLLRCCFAELVANTVQSGLAADIGRSQEAESQFLCKVSA